MVIVVNWLAVISAERCQAPLIPAFEPACKHCCLPCLGSSWAGAAAVCKMETCCSAEFAPLLSVIQGTNWPVLWWQASTCEVQTDLFLLFVSLGDFSGQLLAYLSLGPIFIIVGFVTLIIFKRELHTVSPSLPFQLLLMTKVFSFVAWSSCIHNSFSLFKEQA